MANATASSLRPFGLRDKVSYAFGDIANDCTFILSSTFLLKFYTDVMGIDAVVVGIMMISSFKEIDWSDFNEAVPAFFAGVFMALCYSISYGIAAGFIFYCITKICKKEAKSIHPILWVVTALFILNFVLLAVLPMLTPAA